MPTSHRIEHLFTAPWPTLNGQADPLMISAGAFKFMQDLRKRHDAHLQLKHLPEMQVAVHPSKTAGAGSTPEFHVSFKFLGPLIQPQISLVMEALDQREHNIRAELDNIHANSSDS
jgi:hypothetical protein